MSLRSGSDPTHPDCARFASAAVKRNNHTQNHVSQVWQSVPFSVKGEIPIINVRKMAQAAMFASLMALCAWIALPLPPVSFTLQTFAVLLALGLLGGKWGCVSIGLYLLLGAVGLPVFSGFRGGAAALLDATGGFLWGFFLAGLCYWAMERLGRLPAMVCAMLVCYGCGCFWFTVYVPGISLQAAVLTCVVPYLIPDGIKLWLAWSLSGRIGKHIR